jgi:hypothetical protein
MLIDKRNANRLQPLEKLRERSFKLASKRQVIARVGELSKLKPLIDFDVYLPSRGINLQRPFIWKDYQKRELIMSILLQRDIPVIAIASYERNDDEIKCIVDGKQRLGAFLDFIEDKFTINLEGEDFTCSKLKRLAPDYYKAIVKFFIEGKIAYDLSEEQLIEWFKIINFAGTVQDQQHISNLT